MTDLLQKRILILTYCEKTQPYIFLHYTLSLDNLEGVPENKARNCLLVN